MARPYLLTPPLNFPSNKCVHSHTQLHWIVFASSCRQRLCSEVTCSPRLSEPPDVASSGGRGCECSHHIPSYLQRWQLSSEASTGRCRQVLFTALLGGKHRERKAESRSLWYFIDEISWESLYHKRYTLIKAVDKQQTVQKLMCAVKMHFFSVIVLLDIMHTLKTANAAVVYSRVHSSNACCHYTKMSPEKQKVYFTDSTALMPLVGNVSMLRWVSHLKNSVYV